MSFLKISNFANDFIVKEIFVKSELIMIVI